jgi:hypothetical protein
MIPCLYSQPNVFSKELCEQFINSFEQSQLKKDCDSRLDDGTIHKKSTDIYFQNTIQSEWYINEKELWFSLMEELNQILNKKLNEYYDLYPELNGLPPIETRKFNMQKYNPGEGFARWHFENNNGLQRILVWMIYLNDVDDGGTEFKYQNHLEKAEQGKLLIWPAEWIFTHKGQISNTTTKYILTGWFESDMFLDIYNK